jgi:hypothetical protein
MRMPAPARLSDIPDVRYMSLRDETLLERLNALNPLRQIDLDGNDES